MKEKTVRSRRHMPRESDQGGNYDFSLVSLAKPHVEIVVRKYLLLSLRDAL